MPYLPSHRART